MHIPHLSGSLRLFVLAAALFSCYGSLHSATGQVPILTPVQRPDTTPNPPTYGRRFAGRRADNRSKRVSGKSAAPSQGAASSDKQGVIEQAIAEGNGARDRNEYEQALGSYQRAQALSPREARAFYGMGNVYSDLYCHDSAIATYLKALNVKKDYVEALMGLGYAYAGKERYDDAEKQFREALRIRHDNADANIGLGRIFIVKGKYQDAISQINLVINDKSVQNKDHAAAHVALGDVYWRQEKWEDAVSQFKEAIRLKPDLTGAYIELGKTQAAIAFSKLARFINVNEVSMQDLEALRASEKQAVATLEDAKKYHYNHPNLHEYIAVALAYQFRYEDAINHLNDYFDEVNKLETLISPRVTNCGTGFDNLKADGYWYLGYVYFLKGYFEPDTQRQAEFFDKAIEQFKQATKAKGDYAQAYGMMGSIYLKQNKDEDAVSQLNKAILFSTEEPAKASFYKSIALANSKLGHYDDAISNVREAISRTPNDPSCYETLATVYVTQGNLEETFKWLKKSDEVRTTPSTNPDPYYYLGTYYTIRFIQKRNEEDFNEAIKALKKAIEIRPKYVLAYHALGMAYKEHSNANEALANYKKAAEYDPKNPLYYYSMADVYHYLKDNDDAAIGLLKQAIGVKQDYALAYWKLGAVYHHKKDDAEAVKQFLDAIKYDSKFLPAYLDLAYVYQAQKKYPEAIKYLTTAIEIAPTNPKPYQQMGIVCYERSNADQALANFNRAVEYAPKNPVNYFNMATVYHELKHDDEAAIKQLLKVIEVDPTYLNAYSTLAEIYKGRKDYPEATRYLTAAIGISPSVPETYKDLAKVYEAQGKNEDAIHNYEEALKRLDASELSVKNLYLGRIERLRGRYAEAIAYFQKMNFPEGPTQILYEVGVVYVASKNKKAALEQHQQLVQLKSLLAEDLLAKINDMK